MVQKKIDAFFCLVIFKTKKCARSVNNFRTEPLGGYFWDCLFYLWETEAITGYGLLCFGLFCSCEGDGVTCYGLLCIAWLRFALHCSVLLCVALLVCGMTKNKQKHAIRHAKSKPKAC